jgi:hypothetical protein
MEDERSLEQAEEWDFENAEVEQPRKRSRTVVSVAFSRADFEEVAAGAERMQVTTSEFIRTAAIEAARGIDAHVVGVSGGGMGASFYTAVMDDTTTEGPRHPEIELVEVDAG